MTEGREMITKFLIILQTYKSSGASDRAQKFYDEYSTVSDYFLKVREIVVKKKSPRRIELNNNLQYYNEETIEVRSYPEVLESIILSYQDRYGAKDDVLDAMQGQWKARADKLRVSK